MKKVGIFVVLLFSLASWLQGQEMNRRVYSEEAAQEMLLGYGSRAGMEEAPFSQWFFSEYDAWHPDTSILREIHCPRLQKMQVTLVLGTWCPDSRREVPRFYKVADAMNLPDDNILVIYVDLNKQAPGINLDSLHIERVPTFIFSLDGKEIGRIIETPRGSFEKELRKICHKAAAREE